MGFFSNIQQAVGNVGSAVVNTVTDAGSAVANTVSGLANAGTQSLESAGEFVSGAISTAEEEALTIAQVVQDIPSDVSGYLGGTADYVSGTTAAIVDDFADVVDDVVDATEGGIEFVVTEVDEFGDYVVDTIEEGVDVISDAVPDVKIDLAIPGAIVGALAGYLVAARAQFPATQAAATSLAVGALGYFGAKQGQELLAQIPIIGRLYR